MPGDQYGSSALCVKQYWFSCNLVHIPQHVAVYMGEGSRAPCPKIQGAKADSACFAHAIAALNCHSPGSTHCMAAILCYVTAQ